MTRQRERADLDVSRLARRRLLAQLASERSGIFTASGARELGVSSSALAYHVRTGTIERLGRGVYRLTDIPPSARERLIAAATALGPEAIVSHESALALYDVSDVAPSRLHVTIPRGRRWVAAPFEDVQLHTTTRALSADDVVQHEGFRATSLARSIVDAARAHTEREQIAMAVREGISRGIVSHRELERAISDAPARVRRLVHEAMSL